MGSGEGKQHRGRELEKPQAALRMLEKPTRNHTTWCLPKITGECVCV